VITHRADQAPSWGVGLRNHARRPNPRTRIRSLRAVASRGSEFRSLRGRLRVEMRQRVQCGGDLLDHDTGDFGFRIFRRRIDHYFVVTYSKAGLDSHDAVELNAAMSPGKVAEPLPPGVKRRQPLIENSPFELAIKGLVGGWRGHDRRREEVAGARPNGLPPAAIARRAESPHRLPPKRGFFAPS
jgi:hypothetical protein